jgi:sucrose phosphorylase
MKNQVQLITYIDRLSGAGVVALHKLFNTSLKDLFGGVHMLPFYYPIDGADAGFDPIDHAQVDKRLGDWHDVKKLGEQVDVMADVIVNHMSADSPQFKDYLDKGDKSAYAGLFLTADSVFPNGVTEKGLQTIYRPRPGKPFTEISLKSGVKKQFWTTFTSGQIDINVENAQGRAYLENILRTFGDNGVRMIRLDAAGYAIKRAGKSCFMMPETFAFIDEFTKLAKKNNLEVLVEIHSYYRTQIEIAKKVDWVYDFALPPLVLHAFFFKTARALKEWIAVRPNNALTVLDTHDGIGIIDIGADATDRAARPGLVPPEELSQVVERIHENSLGQSRQATGAAANNLDLYQVNCTYYDALGRNDRAYLLARAIQFFMPGIPQVYYVGLLAGENDMDLLERSGVGRDINRHYYSQQELTADLQKPVVRDLLNLIRLRNTHVAFAGKFQLHASTDAILDMQWTNGNDTARLRVNFADLSYELTHTGTSQALRFASDSDGKNIDGKFAGQ